MNRSAVQSKMLWGRRRQKGEEKPPSWPEHVRINLLGATKRQSLESAYNQLMLTVH